MLRIPRALPARAPGDRHPGAATGGRRALLRRTLLSSIPAAAVTSIRIDGVMHEFTTVPGVKEDITDLILNIKQLIISSEHDEPVVMYLRKQGPGLVTAADNS
jgi:DNA-directed RNA polymerase subunit alpha